MKKPSNISWTDYTFNPWWGCAKVSPGCANCYADTFAAHAGHKELWGHNAARRTAFHDAHWSDPIKWNASAEEARIYKGIQVTRVGKIMFARHAKASDIRAQKNVIGLISGEEWEKLPRPRTYVFSASMADILEDRADTLPNFVRMMDIICRTPNLTWQLLSKRPQNFRPLMAKAHNYAVEHYLGESRVSDMISNWLQGMPPSNVWFGTSTENQEMLDLRLPMLKKIPANLHFLSVEPMLGPVVLPVAPGLIDWVICGGESGNGFRPVDIGHGLALAHQCREQGIPFFWKQDCARISGQQGRIPAEFWDNKQFPA